MHCAVAFYLWSNKQNKTYPVDLIYLWCWMFSSCICPYEFVRFTNEYFLGVQIHKKLFNCLVLFYFITVFYSVCFSLCSTKNIHKKYTNTQKSVFIQVHQLSWIDCRFYEKRFQSIFIVMFTSKLFQIIVAMIFCFRSSFYTTLIHMLILLFICGTTSISKFKKKKPKKLWRTSNEQLKR